MTRDDALFIASRIMDRTEKDKALHLDSIADEVLAGEAIIEDRAREIRREELRKRDAALFAPQWTPREIEIITNRFRELDCSLNNGLNRINRK